MHAAHINITTEIIVTGIQVLCCADLFTDFITPGLVDDIGGLLIAFVFFGRLLWMTCDLVGEIMRIKKESMKTGEI